jgi:hypothetical protein
MRGTIIAMALVLTASVANAAPVLLLCRGEFKSNFERAQGSPGSPTITIDIAADTLVWHDGLTEWVFHHLREMGDLIMSRIDRSEIKIDFAFDITVNRVTGKITWNQKDLGFTPNHGVSMTFEGVCKPAQKLF